MIKVTLQKLHELTAQAGTMAVSGGTLLTQLKIMQARHKDAHSQAILKVVEDYIDITHIVLPILISLCEKHNLISQDSLQEEVIKGLSEAGERGEGAAKKLYTLLFDCMNELEFQEPEQWTKEH